MNCQELKDILAQESVSPEIESQVDRHIAHCGACQDFLCRIEDALQPDRRNEAKGVWLI